MLFFGYFFVVCLFCFENKKREKGRKKVRICCYFFSFIKRKFIFSKNIRAFKL